MRLSFSISFVSYEYSVLMCLEPGDRTHMVELTFYALADSVCFLCSESKDEYFLCCENSCNSYAESLLRHLVEVVVEKT